MHLDVYPVKANEHHNRYEFLSEGPKESVKKVVLYQRAGYNVYNLAFGDWDETAQKADDSARTNNLDRDKVIATVASTIFEFMKHHPQSTILAKGSTQSRTRLYQMGIAKNWHAISINFKIKGFYNGKWELFKHGRNYHAFSLEVK